MTPPNVKPVVISQAQSKRIEDTLCLMARDCRTRAQIAAARESLVAEFLAINALAGK
jgi:hypothetical protein